MDTIQKCSAIEYLNIHLDYYDSTSISLKRLYNSLVLLETIISAFIPFTTLFLDAWSGTRYIIALMGTVVALISVIISRFNFHERWINYRTTHEKLKREKYRFLCESAPYNRDNREQLLIEKVDKIIGIENKSWSENEKNTPKNLPRLINIK